MADITLSDGREITFNLAIVTLREYRALFDKTQPQSSEDEIISKVCGLGIEEYLDMPYQDWRRLLIAFFKRSREPIGADPN
jgi:hypothetical protein